MLSDELLAEVRYVVRTAHGFHYDDFQRYMAKWVRKNHVQTDSHWMEQEIKPNGLAVSDGDGAA